jgi:hypothetical protein
LIRKEPRPGQVSESKSHRSEEDQLIEFRGDIVWSRDRSLASTENRVFLEPIHQQVPNKTKAGNDRLKGDKEADKDEVVDEIDILKSYLELHFFADLIEVCLIEVQSPF